MNTKEIENSVDSVLGPHVLHDMVCLIYDSSSTDEAVYHVYNLNNTVTLEDHLSEAETVSD